MQAYVDDLRIHDGICDVFANALQQARDHRALAERAHIIGVDRSNAGIAQREQPVQMHLSRLRHGLRIIAQRLEDVRGIAHVFVHLRKLRIGNFDIDAARRIDQLHQRDVIHHDVFRDVHAERFIYASHAHFRAAARVGGIDFAASVAGNIHHRIALHRCQAHIAFSYRYDDDRIAALMILVQFVQPQQQHVQPVGGQIAVDRQIVIARLHIPESDGNHV